MRRKVPDVESVIGWTGARRGGRSDWLTSDMIERFSPYHRYTSYDVAAMRDGTYVVLPEMWHPMHADALSCDEAVLARLGTFEDAEAYVIALARIYKDIDLLTP